MQVTSVVEFLPFFVVRNKLSIFSLRYVFVCVDMHAIDYLCASTYNSYLGWHAEQQEWSKIGEKVLKSQH